MSWIDTLPLVATSEVWAAGMAIRLGQRVTTCQALDRTEGEALSYRGDWEIRVEEGRSQTKMILDLHTERQHACGDSNRRASRIEKMKRAGYPSSVPDSLLDSSNQ